MPVSVTTRRWTRLHGAISKYHARSDGPASLRSHKCPIRRANPDAGGKFLVETETPTEGNDNQRWNGPIGHCPTPGAGRCYPRPRLRKRESRIKRARSGLSRIRPSQRKRVPR